MLLSLLFTLQYGSLRSRRGRPPYYRNSLAPPEVQAERT